MRFLFFSRSLCFGFAVGGLFQNLLDGGGNAFASAVFWSAVVGAVMFDMEITKLRKRGDGE